MYLKSLIIKGFKSFADKVTLSLEPGIVAVVGPNGSGKSNISDAVLWVLGERSIRNLRGQAMEDIIFSGSAARKAVSVAEVNLVLDNSDNTLPLDFDEVVITRKAFRSGDTEYYINGASVRRMDVLNILHDTGLGVGTHSIISQGSLDSILRSKPEERRSLIEEAAGVLKHKQRKNKANQKLAAMEHDLSRVRDVANEVLRQLGPLERKAKKALEYNSLNDKLKNLKLHVAVDELRTLRERWEDICSNETLLNSDLDKKKDMVREAESKVKSFQELVRKNSQGKNEILDKQNRANALMNNFEKTNILMEERLKSTINNKDELHDTLASYQEKLQFLKTSLAEHESTNSSLAQQIEESQSRKNELEQKKDSINKQINEIDLQKKDLDNSISESRIQLSRYNHDLEVLQSNLNEEITNLKLIESRKKDIVNNLHMFKSKYEQSQKNVEESSKELERLSQEEEGASESVAQAFDLQEQTRSQHEQQRTSCSVIDAKIKALQESLEVVKEGNPALSWILDTYDNQGKILQSLSSILKVDESIESMVELLLGQDLNSIALENNSNVDDIVSSLLSADKNGDVSFIVGSPSSDSRDGCDMTSQCGTRLLDKLDYPATYAAAIESLLGDVVICSSFTEALKAHHNDSYGLRFASLDGVIVYPQGKICVFGQRQEVKEGILAKERKMDQLKGDLKIQNKTLLSLSSLLKEHEQAFRDQQSKSIKISRLLAEAKGKHESLLKENNQLENQVSSIAKEIEDIDKQIASSEKVVLDIEPTVDQTKVKIAELDETINKHSLSIQQFDIALAPLTKELQEYETALTAVNLERVRFEESKIYYDKMISSQTREIDEVARSIHDAKKDYLTKEIIKERSLDLQALIEKAMNRLKNHIMTIDEALLVSKRNADNVNNDIRRASRNAQEARTSFNVAHEKISNIRIEKARLETQVENAVEKVVDGCNTPLDIAEKLPPLTNRAHLEEDIVSYERKIRSMGSINPNAAQEYEELNERYTYLTNHIADIESARDSLHHIVEVIEEKMKNNFYDTFNQINNHFKDVFSILFPGGSGELVLEQGEDIEHAGIEVVAQPKGKRLTKMMLMSGGEKSLTALALLFAIYRTSSAPFYILDEVEAALDDVNLKRLTSYIDTLRTQTQFIMITHQRRTMEMADMLFGVSMQSDGVTKVISQKLEKALEHAES